MRVFLYRTQNRECHTDKQAQALATLAFWILHCAGFGLGLSLGFADRRWNARFLLLCLPPCPIFLPSAHIYIYQTPIWTRPITRNRWKLRSRCSQTTSTQITSSTEESSSNHWCACFPLSDICLYRILVVTVGRLVLKHYLVTRDLSVVFLPITAGSNHIAASCDHTVSDYTSCSYRFCDLSLYGQQWRSFTTLPSMIEMKLTLSVDVIV